MQLEAEVNRAKLSAVVVSTGMSAVLEGTSR